jgi:LacI family xylobiose transport system transcriptional regulator
VATSSTPRRPLTTAEIAKRAGVSVATVSKVVNGRRDVGPETRSLVEQVIHEWGHRRQRRPSPPAPLIEVVFNVLRGEYAMEILHGAHKVARVHRLSVVVSGLEHNHAPDNDWIDDLLRRRSMGAVFAFCTPTAAQFERLKVHGVQTVLLDPLGDSTSECPSVAANNWRGGFDATRHLLDLGHRRIGVISGPRHALMSRARCDGYHAAIDTAGIPYDPALIREGSFLFEDGLQHTHDLLTMPDPPTAIFACNDHCALGAYQAAHALNVKIPEDLSIVGFDDIPPVGQLSPPLTTVKQPLSDMAAAAATMLVTLSRGETLAQRHVVYSTDLLVRGSTAAPRDPQ